MPEEASGSGGAAAATREPWQVASEAAAKLYKMILDFKPMVNNWGDYTDLFNLNRPAIIQVANFDLGLKEALDNLVEGEGTEFKEDTVLSRENTRSIFTLLSLALMKEAEKAKRASAATVNPTWDAAEKAFAGAAEGGDPPAEEGGLPPALPKTTSHIAETAKKGLKELAAVLAAVGNGETLDPSVTDTSVKIKPIAQYCDTRTPFNRADKFEMSYDPVTKQTVWTAASAKKKYIDLPDFLLAADNRAKEISDKYVASDPRKAAWDKFSKDHTKKIIEYWSIYHPRAILSYDDACIMAFQSGKDPQDPMNQMHIWTKTLAGNNLHIIGKHDREEEGPKNDNTPWKPVWKKPKQDDVKDAKGADKDTRVCFNYNKKGQRCTFGEKCRFKHVCSKCGGPHPAFNCKEKE